MAAAQRPPISEVVVSISFDAQPQSTGPQLVMSLTDLAASYPSLQEQPLYEMPVELPPEEEILKPAIPEFNFAVGPMRMDRRYWLSANEPDPFLIQVQSNYFALNWRDQTGQFEYPGFEAIEADFRRYLSKFEQAILARGGEPLQIKQVEVTYINTLRPDDTWRDVSQLKDVIRLSYSDLPNSEQVSLAYSTIVTGETGAFSGRVHTALQTGYQPEHSDLTPRPLTRADLIPVVNISITTRSAQIKASSNELGAHLQLAHDSNIQAFRSLVTDAALQNWGL
ncbi:TIGR04255 family protein [Actinomycetospora sp. CA-084318]|uniref:TIGR04255 family protein n=1 Tax=Actinomycetospora sp. CA-084318 TaxID=3239892 RepID=UPI003D997F4F